MPAIDMGYLTLGAVDQNLPLVAAGALLLGIVLFPLLAGATNKLNHVPGPFYSSFTNLVFKYHNLRGNRWIYVHQLHARYGPIVRISPAEVSVATRQATKELYKMGSHFYKTDFYDNFNGGSDGTTTVLFSETDAKKHGIHRRRTAWQFSENSIQLMESFIRRNVNLAVQRMSEEMCSRSMTDAYKWLFFMATDIIGEASFGESFNMLESGKKNQYTSDLQRIGEFDLYRIELPWLLAILKPLGLGKQISELFIRMDAYAKASINRYWEAYHKDPDNVKPTLLTKTFGMVKDGTLSPAQLEIDALGNIIAGTDTTATTATSIIYMLSTHPSIQSRLIDEINASLAADFSDHDCRRLPLLNNVIYETLRLCAPVAQGLPRYVPPSGTTFADIFIPGGTVVGIPAYTLHRDPNIFPDPETFDPDRWNDPTPEMKEAFVAFGGGSRICIGMHFAQLELRLALCQFYRTFSKGVEPADEESGNKDMVMFQSFLSTPRGKRLLIKERA